MQMTCKNSDIDNSLKSIYSSFNDFYSFYPALKDTYTSKRQPVHTVYGGAQIWKANTIEKLGRMARSSLENYVTHGAQLTQILGLSGGQELGQKVYERVMQKLKTEPVEDFRIDFEDGYGYRPADEEDHHATIAAQETARALHNHTLPPFCGIRIKPLNPELAARSLRTLDIYFSTLLHETEGTLPPNFVVTLPKIVTCSQIKALVHILDTIEEKFKLPDKKIAVELMVETTSSIMGNTKSPHLLLMVEAADGRCRGAHFGTYDYTAGCDIAASHQRMNNPVCDFAKHVMQVSLAGTGVWLSDGATNVLPIAPQRGEKLSKQDIHENQMVVHKAWAEAATHIRHSLETGFYQGWDLHPHQLPVRYACVYHFFLSNYAEAQHRLKSFITKAAKASVSGEVFDDAATGQGLINYFLRALNCGAITQEEAEATGLSIAQLETRSFAKILNITS